MTIIGGWSQRKEDFSGAELFQTATLICFLVGSFRRCEKNICSALSLRQSGKTKSATIIYPYISFALSHCRYLGLFMSHCRTVANSPYFCRYLEGDSATWPKSASEARHGKWISLQCYGKYYLFNCDLEPFHVFTPVKNC